MAFSFTLLPDNASMDDRVNRINLCFDRAQAGEYAMGRNRILAGRELLACQAIIPRGEWKKWVAANIARGYRDCTRVMAIAYKPDPQHAHEEEKASKRVDAETEDPGTPLAEPEQNVVPFPAKGRTVLSDPVQAWLETYRGFTPADQDRANTLFAKEITHASFSAVG